MRIAVLGSVVQDTIYPPDGGEIKSTGGIYYTISFLANLLDPDSIIYPICNIGYDFYEEFLDIIKGFNNVKTEGLYRVNEKNNKVILKYYDKETREEIATEVVPPLSFEKVEPFLGCDVLLLNFISGFELTLETQKRIKDQSKAFLYMDFHSLALGRDKNGRRFYRTLKDWQEWISSVDFLQMNEKEAESLAERDLKSLRDYEDFGRSLFSLGIKGLNLTLGSEGSLLFWLEDRRIRVKKLHALALERVADVTGCGDAFAAGFICKYWESKDPLKAARYANLVAGVNCLLQGTQGIERIHQLIESNAKRYDSQNNDHRV